MKAAFSLIFLLSRGFLFYAASRNFRAAETLFMERNNAMTKKNDKSRITVLIVVAIVVLTAIGVGRRFGTGDSTLAYSYTKPVGDTLAVAIEMSPLTYCFPNDTAEGLDYEILCSIARKHNLVPAFYPIGELETAFSDLFEGKYDLLIASMPSTSTLKKHFNLSDAVYLDRQVLVQHVDSSDEGYISSVEQLVGDTVYIVDGSPFGTRMRNLNRELGDSIHALTMPGQSAENLAMLTATGAIKRAVVSEAAARRIATDYPELDISTPVSLSHFQCWAISPHDTLLTDSLNIWLRQFKESEQYKLLINKYLPSD